MPVHDVAGPGLVGFIGWAGFLALSPLIVLAEAVVLRLLAWGALMKCLLDAFLMNLASTLLGACIVAAGLLFADPAALWLGLGVGFVLSVLLEGGVLLLLKRHPWRRALAATLAANLVSYAGLAVLAANL